MMFKNTLFSTICICLLSAFCTVGCSGQTEEEALKSLRDMTKDGKMPPEEMVANLENKYAGRKTGALAKLLHARIRFDAGDFIGAASILNSDVFRKSTKVADQALWLRGRALQSAGNHAEAIKVFAELIRDFPESIRIRDAKLLSAQSMITSGKAVEAPPILVDLSEKNDGDALIWTAKAYEAQGSQPEAIKYYRRTYFFAAGSAAAKEAEAKLTALSQALTPQTGEEQLARADRLFNVKNYADAVSAYSELTLKFPSSFNETARLRFVTAIANLGRITNTRDDLFVSLSPQNQEEGYRQYVLGFAKAKMWQQARAAADEMRQKFPAGKLVPKTLIDAGLAARDAKNRADEGYFLNTAVASYPNAVEVAQAQFEAAWFQHENNNVAVSSQMFTDHLALYAGKDSTNRGKAGYWAARDSERAGKIAEACALYEGVMYRYGANWYGYLALNRISVIKNQGNCRSTTPPNETVAKAVANLRTVTVAPETAGPKELDRAVKSDELSTIGLFDWAVDELNEAKKTAPNSPKINLALARYFRFKGDNTSALVAMQKSYPDYAQMFPEEMGQEEWSFFYPLTNWSDIKTWAQNRGLDRYQVAGIIRQETVFNPRAKSGANAYGLMQLLLPTAKTVARSYGASIIPSSPEDLYRPELNIELGTAYMKDQFAKFGRIEYVAIAYNAGPGRVNPWRSTLPAEMDEFVEAIPFKETKGYVQGIIRNSAQYRRLYDEDGNFKSNVGSKPLRGAIDAKSREQFAAEFPDVNVIDVKGE